MIYSCHTASYSTQTLPLDFSKINRQNINWALIYDLSHFWTLIEQNM